MLKIVLTGGSASGKTSVQSLVQRTMPGDICAVYELASEVLHALKCTLPEMNAAMKRKAQREIYLRQIAREEEFAAAGSAPIMLLDRGTVDGAAYWPEGPDAFWEAMSTTQAAELARYDAVIWLESSAAIGLYAGDERNRVRKEDAGDSLQRGEHILSLWSAHPNLRLFEPARISMRRQMP
jgi:AAA domain